MTKKSIKKRPIEIEKVESKIEAYYNVKLNKEGKPIAGKETKIADLNNVERALNKSLHESTEIELWNIVENRVIAESTKRKIQFQIKGYLEHYKLPCKLFKKYLVKDVNGGYPNISKQVSVRAKKQQNGY